MFIQYRYNQQVVAHFCGEVRDIGDSLFLIRDKIEKNGVTDLFLVNNKESAEVSLIKLDYVSTTNDGANVYRGTVREEIPDAKPQPARRNFTRFPLTTALSLRLGGDNVLVGVTRDVSFKGLACEFSTALSEGIWEVPIDTPLTIKLFHQKEFYFIPCTVRNIHEDVKKKKVIIGLETEGQEELMLSLLTKALNSESILSRLERDKQIYSPIDGKDIGEESFKLFSSEKGVKSSQTNAVSRDIIDKYFDTKPLRERKKNFIITVMAKKWGS